MRKPCLIVKSSEWNQMPDITRMALAELAKHVASLTPQELEKIKTARFTQCGSKTIKPISAMYQPKILKIEISETDAGEFKALLDTIEKDPSKKDLARLIVKILDQVPRG